ncbi:hypothetical protein D3C71_1620370 [compost metagenome]
MSTTPDLTPLQLAQQRLANYLTAEARILESQEYTVGQGGTARRNRRADLEQVQAGIKTTQAEIATLQVTQTGGRRLVYLRPR